MATLNFTFDPGTTLQQMLGFEIAGRIWSTYLTDNITLNLQVGVSSALDANVIGGALPGMRARQDYETYRSTLLADRKSTDDQIAYSLPAGTFYAGVYIADPVNGNIYNTSSTTTFNLTRGIAKAAGLNLTNGSTALDGYILFSDLSKATVNGQAVRWSYDFTRSSPQASNTLDFLSTALHEIGHVLGFVSGVDQPGWLTVQNSWNSFLQNSSSTTYTNYDTSLKQWMQQMNPLDMFRYSALTGQTDFSYGSRGGSKYLSFNFGQTAIAPFSTGLDTTQMGDGYQASHWKNGTSAIMNPTLKLNQRSSVAAIDLRALDVIGWDIVPNSMSTNLNLNTIYTQAALSLASRSGADLVWIANNLTTSPSQLVRNRDQDIYQMAVDSEVYNLTKIQPPPPGGWTSRQTFAQVFQQRSLFSMVDELESSGTPGAGNSEIPGELAGLDLVAIATAIAQQIYADLTATETSVTLWPNQFQGGTTPGITLPTSGFKSQSWHSLDRGSGHLNRGRYYSTQSGSLVPSGVKAPSSQPLFGDQNREDWIMDDPILP